MQETSRRRMLQGLGVISTATLLGSGSPENPTQGLLKPSMALGAEHQEEEGQNIQASVAIFKSDITPPIGHPLLGNQFQPSTSISDPLDARGFVILSSDLPIVVVALDWCELRNDAFDRWREKIAAAAGTKPERVMVHTIHQHDAPYFDLTANRLLQQIDSNEKMLDEKFFEEALDTCCQSIKQSLLKPEKVTHLGFGQAAIDDLASNRRVELPDGTVNFSRLSTTRDPIVREAPAGEIDRYVKMISFWNGEKAVAAMSVFAIHPMSHYGRGDISGDFVNLARRLVETEIPSAFQIYASGCCGDVTAGKYNDGAPTNRALFADRLAKGILSAWKNTRRTVLSPIFFHEVNVVLPHSELPELSEVSLREQLHDKTLPFSKRVQSALGLSSRLQHPDGHAIQIPMIEIGEVRILLLPAESFVRYQNYAQGLRDDLRVITLGFGESAPGYIPNDQAFGEGFVKEHGYCWTSPDGAKKLLDAVGRIVSI